MKKTLASLLMLSLLAVPFASASAHPGRTDATGGHTCRTNCAKWGLADGEYHYHNGGSSSSNTSSSKKSTSSSSSSHKTAPKPVAKPKPAPVVAPVPKTAPGLHVHYIDVGQGDATYIKTAAGEDILIDGGNNNQGQNVVNYLKKQGVKDIEVMIATHPDADHIGGLDDVLKAFPVKSVYAPKVANTTKTYEDFLLAVKAEKVGIKSAKAGVTVPVKGVTFKFLGPAAEYSQDDLNDWSAVVRLAYGSTSFLFTGDAEEQAENDMLAAGGLKSDILKVGHHGSRSSTSQGFLNAVAPKYAVISVGKNSYGHPTAETLGKLSAKKIVTYRTDQRGTVVATSNGKTITFKTAR